MPNQALAGCIEFAGYTDAGGYGTLRRDGKMQLAHRVAYCDHHRIPIEDIAGKVIRHTCDNPPCINPQHLLIGSQADNIRDRVERGRCRGGAPSGEDNVGCKLLDEHIATIRARFVRGCRKNGGAALAREYGVSQPTISRIVNNQRRTEE